MKKLLSIIGILSLCFQTVKSQTWSLHQHRADLEFSDIEFLNSSDGFVFGDSSINGVFITVAILKTTDGGQNWTTYALGNSNYRITKSFFLNSTEGFAAGRNGGGNTGLFLKTVDGGATWTNPSMFTEKLYNVCFLNPTIGWVMGKNGLLSKTTDGAMSWNPQSVTNEDINAMRFFNSTQGVMVCGGAEIYITSDAGMSWNLVASNVNEDLISIAINNNNAWICGTAGALLSSSNFGQTWAVQTAAINIDFNDISFPDGSNGYTGGLAGIMNQTQSAGALWQSQNSNCVYEITALSAPDINHGWFCTANGDIYSFDNTTSVSESIIENNSLLIFPNPAFETIKISTDGNTSIKIYDMKGRLRLHQNNLSENQVQTISVKNLIPGIYTVEIISDNKKYYSRLVKANSF
jgi:photosystem II stability/assembly factor-like uncharacterized protein